MLNGTTLTVTGGGEDGVVIVSVALADLLVSVNDVAVMVTVFPVGTMEGAVYVDITEEPGGETAGLNDPQALDPQVAVKTTPAFNGSLVTWTLSCNVALTSRELGIGVAESNATPIGAATMVRLTLLLCDGLLVSVAVMVMVVSMGTTEGAV